MSVTPATQTKAAASGGKRKKSLIELLFEGRAFFALIAIIVVFSLMWLGPPSQIRCTFETSRFSSSSSSRAGIRWSLSFFARHQPRIFPSQTRSAAAKLTVPCRTYSNSWRSIWPAFIATVGLARSSACRLGFSSKQTSTSPSSCRRSTIS